MVTKHGGSGFASTRWVLDDRTFDAAVVYPVHLAPRAHEAWAAAATPSDTQRHRPDVTSAAASR